MQRDYDIAVVGGGLVGVAIAYGLAGRGRRVALLDEGDVAVRASRGNFGLVWVQGKGVDCPAYADWTRHSAELWPAFAGSLEEHTGTRLAYQRPGGLQLCWDQAEFDERERALGRLAAATDGRFQFEMLDGAALRRRLPQVSPTLAGASYCPHDGHVNPLYLLRALHQAFAGRGGHYLPNHAVRSLHPAGQGFELRTAGGTCRSERLVLAAGLGNRALAPALGLEVPVRPNRGQVLVTERVAPFLDLPTVHLRQTAEGSLMLGDSHEDVGMDESTSGPVMAAIAGRAVRAFPLLGPVRLVRAWAALRILTPDGFPVYQESPLFPGAFVVNCHSGVTLAAAHAETLAPWVEGAPLPAIETFTTERFGVQSAA